MIPRNEFIFGPRDFHWLPGTSSPLVRMWNEGMSPSSMQALHSGSHRGSS
jgi:hypothetical protein